MIRCIDTIDFLDTFQKYFVNIIIKSNDFYEKIKNKSYINKSIIYIYENNTKNIKDLKNFYRIFCETEQIKNILSNNVELDKSKIYNKVYEPYDYNLIRNVNNNKIKLLYWIDADIEDNTINIIDEFINSYSSKKNIYLNICTFNKIENKEYLENIQKKINKYKSIINFKNDLNYIDIKNELYKNNILIFYDFSNKSKIDKLKNINKYKFFDIIKSKIDIIYNLKEIVAVVAPILNDNKLNNIIDNYKNQNYLNKKLFIIINLNLNLIQEFFDKLKKENIDYHIIYKQKDKNLGYYFNNIINILKDHNISIFSKFDENCIYESGYLSEQIRYLNETKCNIICKNSCLYFDLNDLNYYINKNYIPHRFFDFCYADTLIFNVYDIYNLKFNEVIDKNIEELFIKNILKNNGRIYSSSIDNFVSLNFNKHIEMIKLDSNHLPKINGKIFNFIFDEIFVINLENHKLRKELFIENNKHTNINFNFFKGVDGSNDIDSINTYNEYMKKEVGYEGCSQLEKKNGKKMINYVGQIGYLKSFLKIFNYAKKQKLKRIIIFDDDVILHKDFNNLFIEKLRIISNNFDILRIGTTCHNYSKLHDIIKTPIYTSQITDGSFAICYNENCYDFMIENIQKYNIPFDSGCLRDYAKNDFTCYDYLAIADLYESSITHNSRNLYDFSNKLGWKLDNFIFKSTFRKISVIFPIYNKERSIINSIKSILAQTYRNIEIILVNDCSTDNTEAIIFDFLKNYEDNIEIKYFKHENNGGCYAARNTAIKNSTGDYIALQDPDDFSLPYRLELQMNDMIKKNIKISYAAIYRMNHLDIDDIDNLEFLAYKDCLHYNQNTWNYRKRLGLNTSLYDKTIFNEFGLFDDSFRHSLDCWFILLIYMNKFNYSLETLNKKVNNNSRGFFFSYISKNLDPHNFIYYNSTLTLISEVMTENNLTNLYKEEKKNNDYEIFKRKYIKN